MKSDQEEEEKKLFSGSIDLLENFHFFNAVVVLVLHGWLSDQ